MTPLEDRVRGRVARFLRRPSIRAEILAAFETEKQVERLEAIAVYDEIEREIERGPYHGR